MMQVIRVCDDDFGGGGYILLCMYLDDRSRSPSVRTHTHAHQAVSVRRSGGWPGVGTVNDFTPPELSKLPVIFPMMQRSAQHHRKSGPLADRTQQHTGPPLIRNPPQK